MSVTFAHPQVLLLLWLAPACAGWWLWLARRRERRLDAFMGPAMRRRLGAAGRDRRLRAQIGLFTAGLMLALIAAARPRWGLRDEVVFRRGRDLLIALDVSRSMLANDVHPNRLERAKADLQDLIEELGGDRAGLLAFRRTGVLLCPLTTDYGFLQAALDKVDIGSAPAGETDLADALDKGLAALDTGDSAHRAIILISDGEDLTGRALEAARRCAERQVRVFAVGLGSRDGVPLRVDGQALMHQGSNVITRLRHETLHEIAKLTGGAYLPIETAGTGQDTLGTLYRDRLRQLAAREDEETLERRLIERFTWFLLPGVALLLGGCALSRGRLETRPRPAAPAARPLKAVALLLAVLPALAVTAAEDTATVTRATATTNLPVGRAAARAAQSLYRQGRHAEAARLYSQAAATAAGEDREAFRFNEGAARFQAGEFTAAAEAFDGLVRTARELDDARTATALGAALYHAAAVTNQDAKSLALRTERLKGAGSAFALAARQSEGAARDLACRDLAAILRDIPAAEEQARLAAVLERYGNAPGFQIADEMLRAQRMIAAAVPVAASNETPARIPAFEALATAQEQAADLWLALKGKLMDAAASTNAQQAAQVGAFADYVRDRMAAAAAQLRDLDARGVENALAVEPGVYQVWKGLAPPPALVNEGFARQTNALAADWRAANGDWRRDQIEAQELTRLFLERFELQYPPDAVVPDPAPGDTNAPPGLTAQQRERIMALTAEALEAQGTALAQAAQHEDPRETMTRARDNLQKIRDLLPKPPPNQDQQQQQQQQNEQQEQEQPQNDQSDQSDASDQQESPAPPKPDENQTQASAAQTNAPSADELSDEKLRQMLERALMREREHDEEKRRRNQQMPMLPSERDW